MPPYLASRSELLVTSVHHVIIFRGAAADHQCAGRAFGQGPLSHSDWVRAIIDLQLILSRVQSQCLAQRLVVNLAPPFIENVEIGRGDSFNLQSALTGFDVSACR